MPAGYVYIHNEQYQRLEFLHTNVPSNFQWSNLADVIANFKSNDGKTLENTPGLISEISNQIKIFVILASEREDKLRDPDIDIQDVFYGSEKENIALCATLLYQAMTLLKDKTSLLQSVADIFSKDDDQFTNEFPESFRMLTPHQKAAETLRLIELVSCRNHPQNTMDEIRNHLTLFGFELPSPKNPNNN